MAHPSRAELLAALPEYDALVVRSRTKVTAQVLDCGQHLKVVGRAGVGVAITVGIGDGLGVAEGALQAASMVRRKAVGLMALRKVELSPQAASDP